MIIKKGQVITFDIKYGGEPEPEVKWIKGEEVCNETVMIKVYYNAQYTRDSDILIKHKNVFVI